MKYSLLLMVVSSFFSFASYSQNVAIERQRVNILYIGVENSINIAVENHSCEDIVVKTNGGLLTPTSDKCRFIYKTDSCDLHSETITVGVNNKGKIDWIHSLEFRVKRIPKPILKINLDSLHKSGELVGILDEFDFDYPIIIKKYSVEILRNDSIIFKDISFSGNRFSNRFLSAIENSDGYDIIRFFDVEISGLGMCYRKIEGFTSIKENFKIMDSQEYYLQNRDSLSTKDYAQLILDYKIIPPDNQQTIDCIEQLIKSKNADTIEFYFEVFRLIITRSYELDDYDLGLYVMSFFEQNPDFFVAKYSTFGLKERNCFVDKIVFKLYMESLDYESDINDYFNRIEKKITSKEAKSSAIILDIKTKIMEDLKLSTE